MDLSVNCSRCGATNKFDQDHIPTFCSFCGAALPDMKPYVQDAIKIALERQRHAMDMETAETEIRKEKVKNRSDLHDTIQLVIVALVTIGVFAFIYIMIKH